MLGGSSIRRDYWILLGCRVSWAAVWRPGQEAGRTYVSQRYEREVQTQQRLQNTQLRPWRMGKVATYSSCPHCDSFLHTLTARNLTAILSATCPVPSKQPTRWWA